MNRIRIGSESSWHNLLPPDLYTAWRETSALVRRYLHRGLLHGLGIEEPVTSPTFTIVQEYETGRIPLYHFDVYRLADPEELEEIGYEEYFFGEGVCLIEWPSRIEELIPEDAVRITIEKELSRGFDYRKITVTGGRVDHE